MAKYVEGILDAQDKKFALVVGRFNEFISEQLLRGAIDCLIRHRANEKDLTVYRVPGSFEIPLMAQKAAKSKKFDAVICLGAVIRGNTPHFDYVANEVTKGIAHTSLQYDIPVSFGIITADTLDQAIERAGTKGGNKGWDAAVSAIEMADLLNKA